MPLLEGKKALVFGVANHRSIAWAIAQALAAEEPARVNLPGSHGKICTRPQREDPRTELIPCDVQNDETARHSLSLKLARSSRRTRYPHPLRSLCPSQ